MFNVPKKANFYGQAPWIWPNACADAENEMFILPQARSLIFDTETTGTSKQDRVIELGYVVLDGNGKILHEQSRLWFTEQKSNPRALAIHQISEEEVLDSPYRAKEELSKFQTLCQQIQQQGGRIVAHNAIFDTRMLRQTAEQEDLQGVWNLPEVFCTLKYARKHLPKGSSAKNEHLFQHFGGELNTVLGRSLNDASGNADEITHRALTDARMTAHVFTHLLAFSQE